MELELDRKACDRARLSRDPRFDGRFFIAVTSTGVYCRPICPARTPKEENVRYFPTAAAAEAAGFRPCLRCRPEASPGTPAWLGTSGLVSRALRLIGEGALDGAGVDALADRLGVTARHLRRLFLQHLGATPQKVAHTRRVHFAKKLVDETALPFHQVAFASGFGSLRRFNAQVRDTFRRTPTELRRLARKKTELEPESYRFQLAYRPPYDWAGVLAFLGARAVPGVESVEGSRYRRTITVDGKSGTVDVSPIPSRFALTLEVRFPDSRALLAIVERVRGLFDLGADPAVIGAHLGVDPLLRGLLARHPGVRAPGAWDGFEIAVNAVLARGSSEGATREVSGTLVSMFGLPAAAGRGPARLFPEPARLATAPLERAGIPPDKAATLRALARQTADGTLSFGSAFQESASLAALEALPGIDAPTLSYIAMRAFGAPDAFPAVASTEADLEIRSISWRPWRAYAAMLLWQRNADSERSRGSRRSRHDADVGHHGRDRLSPRSRAAVGAS
jgi:AraC family transcriptional regulator, regulatory protein of adaptative response / DNA-3-methyladenine glycosylase II